MPKPLSAPQSDCRSAPEKLSELQHPAKSEGEGEKQTPSSNSPSLTLSSAALQPNMATEGQGSGDAPKTPDNERVRALVSRIGADDMLLAHVLLGGEVTEAHFDSCATHCFVNEQMSRWLAQRGYPKQTSNTTYDVSQGNPLCLTRVVHHAPLSIVQESGQVSTWSSCLFIVANAGAPLIICNRALKLGQILSYEPPANYVESLRAVTKMHRPPDTTSQQPRGPDSAYGEPDHVAPARAMTTAAAEDSATGKIDSKLSQFAFFENSNSGKNTKLTSENEQSKLSSGSLTSPARKRRGETEMLTPALPYGRNPPLPSEVMEALEHLKKLSDPATAPTYTEEQIAEIRLKLGEKRPKWASCLTGQQTEKIADKDTELYLQDLMDKPKYQKSIFSTQLHFDKCCDLGEYEMPQHPGRDMWIPAQPRRFKNPITAGVVDDWLDNLLDNNKCRVSRATHPAPVTVVLKPPRDPRVCIDYRNRNARTEVPVYPMPDVQEFLEKNCGFKYYCSFDMAKMFNQFVIKEEDRHLAAFITHRGVYEPNVIMFGLAGAPQHTVRECGGAMALDPLTNGQDFTAWAKEQNAQGVNPPYEICPSKGIVKGSDLEPFIDDVTIPSNHIEGMKKLVELFFEFCYKHNLILSRKKSKLMRTYLQMLGFVVSEEGKHLDPKRIISLLEAARPRSKETLHSLLSSYTFVRMFIPNFSSIAAPLYEATKGIVWKGPQSGRAKGIRQVDPEFVWTPEMERAYDQLRNALLESPILVKVDWNYPLFLSVDASIRGEGWVLWQLITTADGTKVAVAILYGSRKYSESERNWETTRQEASAVRSALTDVADYVFGQHFYLFSDHLNLRFMHHSVNRAVLRMREFLSQFNMTVVHCPGIWNNADALSRLEHEALPVELASNLDSAITEARLSETKLERSIGTDTSEDPFEKGMTDKQPRQASPLQTDGNFSNPRSLCTAAQQHTREDCMLCWMTSSNDKVQEEESDEEEGAWCLSTSSKPAVEHAHPTYQEWDPVLMQAATQLTEGKIALQELKEEAGEWNQKMIYDPLFWLPPFFEKKEQHNCELEEDQEEALWCEPINPKAFCFRAAASERFHSTSAPSVTIVTPETGLQEKTKKRVRFASENHPERLPSVQTVTRGESLETAARGEPLHSENVATEVFVHTASTQTCPMDFKIATIRFPMMDDFKAIHNHDSGHHGLEYSYRKLLKHCGSKWANVRGDATRIKDELKQFIDACPICQKVRGLREKIKPKNSFIISRPFLEASWDYIVFRNEDKNGNRYLLVVIDNFLKLTEMKPLPHREAESAVKFLLELQARYGPMARLRTDNEGAFTGLLVQKLNLNRGTELAPCIPYHPQANSICERQNAIIMDHLNALVLECKLGPASDVGWSDLIPKVFSIVNNTPKNPLGISPLAMLYGVFGNYDKPLLTPTAANLQGNISNPVDYVDALMAWQSRLLEITEDVQSKHFEKLSARLEAQRKQKDGNKPREFNVGDFVLQIKTAGAQKGKPSTKWTGPFLVAERRENDPSHPVLDLIDLSTMQVKQASTSDCRQFNTAWFDDDTMLNELTKLAATDRNEYVIDQIVSHRPPGETRNMPLNKYFFEVKWQDFPDTTWEPFSGVKDTEPFEEYAQAHPGLKLIKP